MEIWACEEKYLRGYLQKKENLSSEDVKSMALFQMPEVSSENRLITIYGNTASINREGVLSKKGPSRFGLMFGYGGTGYDEIIEAAEMAKNNPEITNVNLIMNTPGGRVTGVDEARQAIELLSKEKNVTAINTGMIASAGYWIATAANKIYSTSAVNETGSIGVVVAGIDWTEYDKKMGIKEVVILSKNAENKYAGIESADGIKEIQREVDAIERVFLKRVADGRKKTVEEVIANFGKGGILIAEDPGKENDASTVGMIDGLVKIDANNVFFENKSSLNITPANAENKKPEVKMDLLEAIAKHPAIGAQVELKVQEAKAAGIKEGTESKDALIKKTAVAFDPEKSYPNAVIALAKRVLEGTDDVASLTGAITVIDAQREEKKSEDAKAESEKHGETFTAEEKAKADGIAKTVDDVVALSKKDNGEV